MTGTKHIYKNTSIYFKFQFFYQYFNENENTLSKDTVSLYHKFKNEIENIAYIFTLNNKNKLDD
jgi:hypothetical protein